MNNRVNCPHITEAGLHYCMTGGMTYLPRPRRLNYYCMSRMHEDCGLYMAAAGNVRPFTYRDR